MAATASPGDPASNHFHYTKARLPRGESYPLKRSDLDAILAEVEVPRLRAVYLSRGSGGRVMAARLSSDCDRGASAGTTTLHVMSVPSEVRRDVRAALLAGGADLVVAWVAGCERASEAWRLHRHHISLAYTSERGRFRVVEDGGAAQTICFPVPLPEEAAP